MTSNVTKENFAMIWKSSLISQHINCVKKLISFCHHCRNTKRNKTFLIIVTKRFSNSSINCHIKIFCICVWNIYFPNNMFIKKLLIYALTRWLMGNNFIWTSCLRLWRHIWHFDFKHEMRKKSEVQVYVFSHASFGK